MSGLPVGFIAWSPSEASTVNEFLNTPTGRKWLAILLSRKPQVSLKTTEEAALTGSYAAGYEHFFSEIASTRSALETESPGTKSIDMVRD